MLRILVFCLLFLISCSKDLPCQRTALRINIPGDPTTLDPRKGGDVVSSTMHFLLFEGLTRLNTDGTVTPAQAEFIEISKDRKKYTFHLRQSFWSDGTPVTAYDFESAWKKILSPDFPAANAHLLYPIKNAERVKKGELSLNSLGVHSLSDKILQVELSRPTPYFLDLVSFCLFFPVKHDLDSIYPQWANHCTSQFVSNGPFKLEKWKHTQEIIVVKNPYYWAKEQIKLPAIHISMVSHEMTILHMYENQELDLLDMWISPIPIEAQIELAKKKLLKTRPIGGSKICVFNTQTFPFHNAHIRKAFALALDRQTIVNNITQMEEVPALQAIPAILKNKKNSPLFKDNDQEAALIELNLGLQELEIEKQDLNHLIYSYSTSERNHKIAQILQQQWSNVLGIKVKLQAYDLKVQLEMLSKRNFQFAQSQWFAQYNDPMNFLERFQFSHNIKNYSGWENNQFKEYLDASYLETLFEDRLALLEKAEALLINEMPIIPLYHWNSGVLAQPYLKNVHLFNTGNPDFTRIEFDARTSSSSSN